MPFADGGNSATLHTNPHYIHMALGNPLRRYVGPKILLGDRLLEVGVLAVTTKISLSASVERVF